VALSPLSLADLHLEVLYERDKAGLLLRARGASTAAADFHLVRTVDGNRWGISAQLSEGDRAQLHKALSQEAVFGTAEEMECREPFITREGGGSFGYRVLRLSSPSRSFECTEGPNYSKIAAAPARSRSCRGFER
jgi:hypothetical protein